MSRHKLKFTKELPANLEVCPEGLLKTRKNQLRSVGLVKLRDGGESVEFDDFYTVTVREGVNLEIFGFLPRSFFPLDVSCNDDVADGDGVADFSKGVIVIDYEGYRGGIPFIVTVEQAIRKGVLKEVSSMEFPTSHQELSLLLI